MSKALLHTICSTIRHQKWRAVLLSISVSLIVLAVTLLSGLTARQEEKIEELVRDTKIHCIVTDSHGTNSENLMMLSYYVDMLMGHRHERGCYLDEVVTNVCALSTQHLESPGGYELRRITCFDSDTSISRLEGTQIQMYDGWDETVFSSNSAVCLVSDTTSAFLEDDEGKRWMRISDGVHIRDLQIIGEFSGGHLSSIYVPFYFEWDPEMTSAFTVDSCSFIIQDNSKLEESKEEIYSYFSKPSLKNGHDVEPYGVLVQDQIYLESLEKLRSSLEMLRILLPMLAVLGGVMSFIATYITTRGRQKELAVMRCLGLRCSQIFALVVIEQIILVVSGGVLGICLGLLIGNNMQIKTIVQAGGVIALFILGSCVAAMKITKINVMKLMKVED